MLPNLAKETLQIGLRVQPSDGDFISSLDPFKIQKERVGQESLEGLSLLLLLLLALKMEEGDTTKECWQSLKENPVKQIPPRSYRKKCSSADMLILMPLNCLTSNV